MEVTHISYRKKNVKSFPLRGKEEGGDLEEEGDLKGTLLMSYLVVFFFLFSKHFLGKRFFFENEKNCFFEQSILQILYIIMVDLNQSKNIFLKNLMIKLLLIIIKIMNTETAIHLIT